MKTNEILKSEETKLPQEELTDLTVDDKEQASEVKGGGAVAGIVIAATSDNNR